MPQVHRFGRAEVRLLERQVLVDGQPVAIGARAFDVLASLIARRDRVVPKAELLDAAWPGMVVEENNLQVQISTLRKLLGQGTITTVPGQGYRFTARLEEHGPPPAALSVAVLPFANLSRHEDSEYFADGLTEELINLLSRIRGIRVASRTSAFYFKGKDPDLATVASKLNVAAVIAGSVRSAGNRVRVSAQLVQVASDALLWSDTYERELSEIFALQDEVARAVVMEIRASLAGEASVRSSQSVIATEVKTLVRDRGQNPEAYRLYLQGIFFVNRNLQEDNRRGVGLLRQALDLEPDFALAWTGLARAYRHEAEYFQGQNVPQQYEAARAAVRRALELAPGRAEGYIELGRIRTSDWDWQGGGSAINQALELAPDNVDALLAACVLARVRGFLGDAIVHGQRAVQIDPLSVEGHTDLGRALLAAGRLDEAEESIRTVLDLNPRTGAAHGRLGILRLMQRRPEEAIEAFGNELLEYARLTGLALASHALGRASDAEKALNALRTGYADSCAFQIAEIHASRGHTDAAFEWLERAYLQRDHGMHAVLHSFFLKSLHADARWRPFIARLGLST